MFGLKNWCFTFSSVNKQTNPKQKKQMKPLFYITFQKDSDRTQKLFNST